jgi:transcriptional antiterminator Rof (Rho-off)
MTVLSQELARQIETAFDYRGHVTITLKDGERMQGYVYNREFAHPLLREAPFIELFLAENGESRKVVIDTIQAIELTGKNYAAEGPVSHGIAAPESRSREIAHTQRPLAKE